MSDLVERLRHASANAKDEYQHELTGRAADHIEALTAQLARARATVISLLYIVEDDGSDYVEVAAKARTLLAELDKSHD